jgi:DnaJ-class molecular chaperone
LTRVSEKPQNYYELLGLQSRNFTPAELKKAYREASRIYHPDKNPEVDTTDKFLEIKTASEILGSEFVRMNYDLFFQTKFEQEENLHKQLELQGLPEEQIQAIFHRSMANMRAMRAIIEAVPSAIAWTLTTVLLVNVSLLFITTYTEELWSVVDCLHVCGVYFL